MVILRLDVFDLLLVLVIARFQVSNSHFHRPNLFIALVSIFLYDAELLLYTLKFVSESLFTSLLSLFANIVDFVECELLRFVLEHQCLELINRFVQLLNRLVLFLSFSFESLNLLCNSSYIVSLLFSLELLTERIDLIEFFISLFLQKLAFCAMSLQPRSQLLYGTVLLI